MLLRKFDQGTLGTFVYATLGSGRKIREDYSEIKQIDKKGGPPSALNSRYFITTGRI